MQKNIKVLSIGQLPIEQGGSYTTGVTNVVYELSKQRIDGIESYLYSTNITEVNAQKLCSYPLQYMGYKINVLGMLWCVLRNPIRTLKEWHHYRTLDHRNPLRFELYKYNFKRAIKNVNPDIIHMHAEGLSPLYYANRGTGIPIIQTYHGVFYRGDPNDIVMRDRHLGCIDYIDYATGLTSETHDEITKILGFTDESRIFIIPNGIDTSKVYYSEKYRNRIREEFNVQSGQTVFVTMASVQVRKGQLAFIKILESLSIDFQYWIIGKGEQFDEIAQYIENKGLGDRVKMLGYRDNDKLYQYYSAADIYAHASTMEGQALSEIEAYTTGLRTVVNKLIEGTVVGDINDKNHYFVLDFEKPDEVNLKEWINTPSEQERKTNPEFEWSEIARRYGEVYKTIMNKKENDIH